MILPSSIALSDIDELFPQKKKSEGRLKQIGTKVIETAARILPKGIQKKIFKDKEKKDESGKKDDAKN